jgi:hypothetical protein
MTDLHKKVFFFRYTILGLRTQTGTTKHFTPLFSLKVKLLQADVLHNKSVALVRELIIPTERPPLVGEVSDTFRG